MKITQFNFLHVGRTVLLMLGALFFINVSASSRAAGEESPDPDLLFVNVWDNDGGCVSYPLTEYPRFEYNYEDSVIHCITTLQDIEFPMVSIHKYTLDDTPGLPTAIGDAYGTDGRVSYSADNIYLSGFEAGADVWLYSSDGMLISHHNTDAAGSLSIPMSSLAQGVYIIKAHNVSYKISKK